MALKKKEQPEAETPKAETVQTKPKRVVEKGGGDTPAQLVAALLRKDKKVTCEIDVIFDPSAPLVTANNWVSMPAPWQQLTGVKGVPFGQVTTIQGKPDSGKTTVAMHAMTEAQEQGFNVVLIDTEHKFNKKRFQNMGGDVTNYLHAKCETIEEGFEVIEKVIDQFKKVNGKPTLVVWDSLGQTPTDEEMKGTSRSHTVASAAKVIKKNLRRLRSKFAKADAAILFINQVYDNINALFGNSTKGYGGNGAYFASSLVLEVQRIRNKERQFDKVKRVVGVISGIKCTKNHMSDVQGGKAQVLIGPLGIDQETIADLNDDGIKSLAEDDDEDEMEGLPPKKRGGREVRL